MKIAFFDVTPKTKVFMKNHLPKDNLLFFGDSITKKDIFKIKDCDVISISIHSNIDKKIINSLPRLKLISTRSTGYDHIDIEYCKSKKINVCNVPFYGENTVAEHTFALILALSRKIHETYERVLDDNYSIDGLQGFDLRDKTIGIIGGGHIGMHVARMAKGFEMHVRVYDSKPNNFLASLLGFKYVSLNELLKVSDVITLHVPYNKATHHLINKKTINMMKKGVIIINTARGGVIDTDALYHALKSNNVAGAGLDVIEGEQYITEDKEISNRKNHLKDWNQMIKTKKIFKMKNVLFTPHNAFNSKEANTRILESTVESIKGLKSKKPINLVI